MKDIGPKPSSQGIYILAGIWLLVMLSAYIAPGIATAYVEAAPTASALLTLLSLLSLGALVAVWLLLQALTRYRELTPVARVAGILPCLLNTAAILWVWAGLTG